MSMVPVILAGCGFGFGLGLCRKGYQMASQRLRKQQVHVSVLRLEAAEKEELAYEESPQQTFNKGKFAAIYGGTAR